MKELNTKFTKAVHTLLAVFFLLTFVSPVPVQAVGEIGIDSWTKLQGIGAVEGYPLNGSYILTRDLTPEDEDYTGIGDDFAPIGGTVKFTGTFDGNNHEIQGMNITAGGDIGLFNTMGPAGSILDLDLTSVNMNISTMVGEVGGLVGISEGTIINCSVTGLISSTTHADLGGMVGWLTGGGSIEDSHVGASVDGNTDDYVAGLVGYMDGTSRIVDSYATGDVAGNRYLGGLVGNADPGTEISTSYATGNVSGVYDVGGFVGRGYGNISKSYATGNVVGSGSGIGGFIGRLSGGSTIEDSYSWGDVSGADYTGGFAGIVGGQIANSYALGSVEATLQRGGGFVSIVDLGSSVMNSFTASLVTTPAADGGFASDQVSKMSGTNHHWLKHQSGPQTCYLDGDADGSCTAHTDPSYFKGNSNSEPMASWDFNTVWQVVPGDYPILAWQPAPATPDETSPVFANLPGADSPINITEGQLITTNPFVIQVKPTDEGGVQLVEFYVDDVLICTSSTPDEDGVYSCDWDTSKYHSDIRIVAYDNGENSAVLTRSATVDPSLYLTVLPKTGE